MLNVSGIAFSGAGNMAGAIIEAVLKTGVSADKVFIYDVNPDRIAYFREKGIGICSSNIELVNKADIVFLAVKPQVIYSVLSEISGLTDGKCIVSIAAGISSESVRNALSDETYIIRALPNTPMLDLCGATVIAEPSGVPDFYINTVREIFEAAGIVSFLPENLINSVIPLSSSSPAFFFRMISAMAREGERLGISYEDSLKLSAYTMLGSAKLLLNSGRTPEELIRQVSSPGGTTVAALTAFDDFGFEGFIREAFKRCVNRADELGGGK